jgi:hypothetical protein
MACGRGAPTIDRIAGLSDLMKARIGFVHRSCDARNHLPCGPSKLEIRGCGVRTLTIVSRARDVAAGGTCGRGAATVDRVEGRSARTRAAIGRALLGAGVVAAAAGGLAEAMKLSTATGRSLIDATIGFDHLSWLAR